jgi:hypothetical protein
MNELLAVHYVRFFPLVAAKNKYAIIDSIHSYHMFLHVPCRYRPPGTVYEKAEGGRQGSSSLVS